MTRYTPLWEQQGTYAASLDRRLPGALWPAGAAQGGAVTPSSAMTVNIAVGMLAVPITNGTGSVLCVWDAIEQVTFGAAPGAGLSRIDLVVATARGNDFDGGVNNDWLFQVIAGTAVASPVAPAVPANSLAIAQALIPNGMVTITTGALTDVRPGPLAVTNLPAPVTTGTTVSSFTDAAGEVWVAKAGVYGGTWHKARDVVHARRGIAAGFSTATSATPATFDTVVDDVLGLYTGGLTFTAPVAGQYLVTGQMGAVATATAQWLRISLRKNGTQVNEGAAAQSGGAGPLRSTLDVAIRLAAADTLAIWYDAQAALTGAAGIGINYVSFDYMGTG